MSGEGAGRSKPKESFILQGCLPFDLSSPGQRAVWENVKL